MTSSGLSPGVQVCMLYQVVPACNYNLYVWELYYDTLTQIISWGPMSEGHLDSTWYLFLVWSLHWHKFISRLRHHFLCTAGTELMLLLQKPLHRTELWLVVHLKSFMFVMETGVSSAFLLCALHWWGVCEVLSGGAGAHPSSKNCHLTVCSCSKKRWKYHDEG